MKRQLTNTGWDRSFAVLFGLCAFQVMNASLPTIAATSVDCKSGWVPTFDQMPGLSHSVTALEYFDDGMGDGPVLFVGGGFNWAGNVPAMRVARWNGESWSTVGEGLSGGSIWDMIVFDDGTGNGPELYAAGEFSHSGDTIVGNVAKWNGKIWTSVGGGVGIAGYVHSLAVFDDGSGAGPSLYAGGTFNAPASIGAFVSRWNGQSWEPVGSGTNGTVYSLNTFDDGTGPALYAGGAFTVAGGQLARRIARWDGQNWSPVGAGDGTGDGSVRALEVHDDGLGDGPALFAAGGFSVIAGTPANGVAKWNGDSWTALGEGISGLVEVLTSFRGTNGEPNILYAGGGITNAGGMPVNEIAGWDGESWTSLDQGVTEGWVYALATRKNSDGADDAIVVGGTFIAASGLAGRRIAYWDGNKWIPFSTGINAPVLALESFNDGLAEGSTLYVGGMFSSVGGFISPRIARWNGERWYTVGDGLNGYVHAMTVYDDGSGHGPALYAAGEFTHSGDIELNHVARWDGKVWTPLGQGIDGDVEVLFVFDDGTGDGPALLAGGSFDAAGGEPARNLARWDGEAWSEFGGGVNGPVRSIATFDHWFDSGEALYVAGNFDEAGSVSAYRVARWEGDSWSDTGLQPPDPWDGATGVSSIIAYHEDGVPLLFASGGNIYNGYQFMNQARWNGLVWVPQSEDYTVGPSARLYDLDGIGGPELYMRGGPYSFKRLDGTASTTFGEGFAGSSGFNIPPSLVIVDHGLTSGRSVYVGGAFFASKDTGDSFLARYNFCDSNEQTDFDGDGIVGLLDLLALLSMWGDCEQCAADLNGDGVVDLDDMLILLGNWSI